MDETGSHRPPKTIAVEPTHTHFWTASLCVDDESVECETSHPYDGVCTEWKLSHEAFLAGSRHEEISQRFSPKALADALAEIQLRRGTIKIADPEKQ